MIRITECPRDAMQGIKQMIPAATKAAYINQLLKVGFEVIDFGSFVSPKAIPQMADTPEVLLQLDLSATKSKLLAIVANVRGATEACAFEAISLLGYPFSISETFQQRNANSTIAESLERVKEIQALCSKHKKELRVYISMAFGNPYGDPWDGSIALKWCRELRQMGIRHLALADTVGSSTPESISELFKSLTSELQDTELIAHLHSTPEKAAEKIKAAYDNGCRSFDAAVHGFGGCPMAADELTGNISTQTIEKLISEKKISNSLNTKELKVAYEMGWELFNKYH